MYRHEQQSYTHWQLRRHPEGEELHARSEWQCVLCSGVEERVPGLCEGNYRNTFSALTWTPLQTFPCHTDSVWDLKLHNRTVVNIVSQNISHELRHFLWCRPPRVWTEPWSCTTLCQTTSWEWDVTYRSVLSPHWALPVLTLSAGSRGPRLGRGLQWGPPGDGLRGLQCRRLVHGDWPAATRHAGTQRGRDGDTAAGQHSRHLLLRLHGEAVERWEGRLCPRAAQLGQLLSVCRLPR